MNVIKSTLPSGKPFSLDLNLNHPSLLPGVQVLSEHVLFKGGKLFRPKLCFMVAEALNVPFEQVRGFARIAELVHAATLSHDDVIDVATERRNKATLNHRLTQARAILAGDLMLSRAMVELCELGNPEILKRMAEVLEDLVTGEWIQIENRGVYSVTQKYIDTVAYYKTASMIEWCIEVPFRLKNESSQNLERARRLGREMGLGFQIVDDCVDFNLESGKDFAKDLSEGLLNQVSWRLVQFRPELKTYFKEIAASTHAVDQIEFLEHIELPELESAIGQTRLKAKLHIQNAHQILNELESEGCGNFIHIRTLLEWIIKRER